ncbi:MAG: hypothetical protein QXO15_11705 [Nitrososphaerota archaeon]
MIYDLRLRQRKILAALMFGVAAGALASIAERVDAALTAGRFTPLGYINAYTWILVSALLLGPLAPIITTEIQAFIGLLTFANPLSWLWPIINLIFAVAVGFALTCINKIKPQIKLSLKVILLSLTCALLDIPLVYVVIVVVLNLPLVVYWISLPFYIALQLIPTTILSYIIVKRLKYLKFFQEMISST